ncbi:putative entry exclusion protein TrbK-alt [Bradyrhizobium erythrophlei]|uniref:putative entry exclusion protein TrbK-alt n=1 Tax=Bradyrhizobium erythrophlei TaxID=1437360 RepID=UPI0035EF1570
MNVPVSLKRLPAVLALGVTLAAAAACAIQLRQPSREPAPARSSPQKTATLEPDLARCRTVTSEQGAAYERCRRIWVENRRRFFGQKAGPVQPTGGGPGGSSQELAPKDQSRIPQGDPSVTMPGEGSQ